MDLLSSIVSSGLQASTPGPADDFWYQNFNVVMTSAGMRVDEEGARKISAWYRGRDILATSLAMLPLHVYRRLPNDGGREVATSHPLEDVLHSKPAPGWDSFQYRRQAMFDVIDGGWFYADITPGGRGFVDTLPRIDPKRVTPEQIDEGPLRGRWKFTVRNKNGGDPKVKRDDQVFYLRGAEGKGILEYARDSLGLGLVLENYAARIFSKGSLNAGYVETPGPMPNEEQMRAFARQFMTAVGDWHLPKVIPFGAKFATGPVLEPEKAQMILSRKFSVIDIARWLGLPAHMLNEVDTAGVTGLEQKGQEFVTFNLGGWLAMWEFAINDQLILNDTYYAEFTREALSRADIEARGTYDVESVNAGIETPDEIRVRRNLPKMGGKASELREPQNITGKGAKGGQQDNRRPGRTGDGDDDRAQEIVVASAARMLEKEIKTVAKLAVDHARDGDAFAAAVTDFYAGHVGLLTKVLLMPKTAAERYCSSQAAQAIDDGMVALERWKHEFYAHGLAALALEAA